MDIISTGDELRFTVAEDNVSQFVALEKTCLDLMVRAGATDSQLVESIERAQSAHKKIDYFKALYQSWTYLERWKMLRVVSPSRESAKYFKENPTNATVNDVPKSVLDLLKREAI